jgi:hypothetical protein
MAGGDVAGMSEPGLSSLRWRTGTHNPRTIYAVTGGPDHYQDVFIGTLDTAELVAEAVAAHNARLEAGSA